MTNQTIPSHTHTHTLTHTHTFTHTHTHSHIHTHTHNKKVAPSVKGGIKVRLGQVSLIFS